jgi:hypothetical protein
MNAAVAGVGSFKSAPALAEELLAASGGDVEEAVDRMIRTHVRLAAANGAVTSLGGLLTLPVTLPAGLGGYYLIGTRLACGIACLRGYDPESEEVRTTLLLVTIGSAATEVLRTNGVAIGAKGLATALSKLPPPVLVAINKAIGTKLVTKAGGRGAASLGRIVPLVGAPIGGTVDYLSMQALGRLAKKEFPAVPQPAPSAETPPPH